MERKKLIMGKYGFALIVILIGLFISYDSIKKEFLGFSSVGSWLIYVGFVMLAVITLQFSLGKKRIIDERSQFIGMKAARWAYVFIIFSLFVTMIVDGIKSITIPYSQFMSMFICGITLVYFIAYKIIEKKN